MDIISLVSSNLGISYVLKELTHKFNKENNKKASLYFTQCEIQADDQSDHQPG
jgi:hypothetical protein